LQAIATDKMDDLLTTHDVQALLRLDRTTIYRMIKTGRLSGARVGQQWRLPRQNVEALLSGANPPELAEDPVLEPPATFSPDILPLHCMQAIQDVFAELAQIGAVTTRLDGVPLVAQPMIDYLHGAARN
jgi:excisionase family DNA binding protein